MDNNFIALLKAMPKPLALGLGIAIALAILARILLPALLELLEADLPLRTVTQYLALAVGWAPVPGGVTVFLFYLWKAILDARRDNRPK